MKDRIMNFEQFAKDISYTVKIEIVNDEDDTIATTEIELTPVLDYDYLINTDEVIEWLGSMERDVFSNDIKVRYDEYLESFEE